MSRYGYTSTTGQVASTEVEVIVSPRTATDGTAKRGVILAHGAGNFANVWTDTTNPGSFGLLDLLGGLGFVVVAADLGGPLTFGADLVSGATTGRIAAAWNLLQTLGVRTDKVIGVGASMGALNMLNAARAGAVPFSGIAGFIPLSDLDDFRDNNRAGGRDGVNTAWSLTLGSTSSTVPLPARANPNTTANAAAIVASCPRIYLSKSTADSVIPSATVSSLAAKLTAAGGAVTEVTHSTSLDHGDASLLAAVTGGNRDALITFLGSVT